MKVKIGKYPSQKALKKDPTAERKVEVRIDPTDLWSLDCTLAYVIAPALKALKEVKHGSPSVADEDVPAELRKAEGVVLEFHGDVDDSWHARWEWVLDEMIWAFEQVNTDWEEQFHHGEHPGFFSKPVDVAGNEVPEAEAKLFEMIMKPTEDYWVDWDGMRAYEQRMANGFRLFGKYYLALWD